VELAVLLCVRCGSHEVDIRGWSSRTVAVMRCSTCDHESPVAGFTVGRVFSEQEPSMVREAIEDAALPVGVR